MYGQQPKELTEQDLRNKKVGDIIRVHNDEGQTLGEFITIDEMHDEYFVADGMNRRYDGDDSDGCRWYSDF